MECLIRAFCGRRGLTCAALLFVTVMSAAPQRQSSDDSNKRPQQRAAAREMLAAHNAIRARMKVPPLAWSDELARYAQGWASRLATENRLIHRSRPVYGENLYLIHGAQATAGEVVQAWASEAASYDYQTNSCRGQCGHYTQMVWRDTKRVGCGRAMRDATEVWVCNYDPPGNIVGERPY